MPAPAKYPVAHEQLIRLAKDAKNAGVPFDDFWEEAVRPGRPAVTWKKPEADRPKGAVVWPSDTQDRQMAVAVTLGAREGWRRAYEDVPMKPREEALARIRPGLAALGSLRETG